MVIFNDDAQKGDELGEALKTQAQALIEHLEKGNMTDAIQVIHDLNDVRDRSLYQEVGRLTRALHESIVNFQIDTFGGEETSQMADASDRLGHVTKMTENAANRTMDLVDSSSPVAAELGAEAKQLSEEWGRLKRREMKPQEFRELYQRMGDFLAKTEKDSGTLYNSFNDIVMAQDYQDLTGQVIKRVVDLVHEIEQSLVGLVKMAGQVDQITGIEHDFKEQKKASSTAAEGPQLNKEHSEVVSGQDDVDDLLSSLGF